MSMRFVGIDVAKARLDVAVRPDDVFFSVEHTPEGRATLVSRLQGLAPTLIVVEATGAIEQPLVDAFRDAPLPVAVVNARQVRNFARATGKLAKTDRLDAQVLALFAELIQPPLRDLPTADHRALEALMARRAQPVEMIVAERNRWHASHDAGVRAQIERHLLFLEEEQRIVEVQLDAAIMHDPVSKSKLELLLSVPGIGKITAWTLLSDVPELGHISGNQVAAQLGDHDTAARISQLLAAMYATRGHVREAMRLLQGALPALETHPNRTPYLTALCTLADLQQEMMLYDEATQTVDRAEVLASETGNTYNRTRLAYSAAYISLVRGDQQAHLRHLDRLLMLARASGDSVMLEKGLCLLADHHSRLGEHPQALRCLVDLYSLNPEASPTVRLTEAMLARRRGDPQGAYRLFAGVVERAEALGQPLLAARARLQMVYSLYLTRDYDQVRVQLPQALNALVRFGTPGGPLDLRQDFPELSELFAFAELDPVSEPVLASLLGRAAERLGGAPDLLSASVHVELLVLGQETVLLGGIPLHFRLKRAVGVLFYLSLYPGRTRREIALDLFPDKEARVAGGYINSAISEIGQVAGPIVRQDGPHNAPTYALSRKVSVTSDYQLLRAHLAENNLPGAYAAFRGSLLPAFEDSEWLSDLRTELTRNARLTLEVVLEDTEAQGDWARVVLLCSQGMRFGFQDPEFEVAVAERALWAARLSGQARLTARCELELERLLRRIN